MADRGTEIPRRTFLAACGALLASPAPLAAALGQDEKPAPLEIKKAVKIGMVRAGKTLTEKFALVKDLGFDGIELDSPNQLAADEVLAARDHTGLPIHGVVDSIHWQKRLSDPNPSVRAQGVHGLQTALRDAKAYGGSSVLLVPARVTPQERYDQCWERSQAEIRKVLPLADELGIDILIENVWNDFLLSPLEMARYTDELGPRVGCYFDVGNIVKFGRPADWIRILGARVRKLDVKGFHRPENAWVPIGEGTEDWPDVCKALREVGYRGWATAEVGGGGRERLQDIKQRMDRVFAH